jgi:hypothetical protein
MVRFISHSFNPKYPIDRNGGRGMETVKGNGDFLKECFPRSE